METEDDFDYWNTSDQKAYSFDDVEISVNSNRNRTSFKLVLDDAASDASYELPQNDLSLDSIISFHDLQLILEEQALSSELRVPKGLSAEEELKLLRRQTFNKQSPERAISTLLFGQSTSLEFKSLSEKEILIDLAIDSGNGDAILYVVLFLEETLNQSLFHQLLRQRPDAANHYKTYLCARGNIQKCSDFLTMLGLHNEAALVHFRAVLAQGRTAMKRQRIKSIYNDYFSQPGTAPFLSQMVSTYLNLMNWQAGEQGGAKNQPDLVGDSTLRSLFHCSRSHHWPDGGAVSVNNPYAFAKQFQVLDSQFEYVVLVERARNEAWISLESIFEKKNLLKQRAFQIQLPLDKVILKLHQLSAPQGTLFYFLTQLNDLQRRLTLARSVQCPKAIIDCYVGLKLKGDLVVYKDSLPGGSPERFYADKSLNKLK